MGAQRPPSAQHPELSTILDDACGSSHRLHGTTHWPSNALARLQCEHHVRLEAEMLGDQLTAHAPRQRWRSSLQRAHIRATRVAMIIWHTTPGSSPQLQLGCARSGNVLHQCWRPSCRSSCGPFTETFLQDRRYLQGIKDASDHTSVCTSSAHQLLLRSSALLHGSRSFVFVGANAPAFPSFPFPSHSFGRSLSPSPRCIQSSHACRACKFFLMNYSPAAVLSRSSIELNRQASFACPP